MLSSVRRVALVFIVANGLIGRNVGGVRRPASRKTSGQHRPTDHHGLVANRSSNLSDHNAWSARARLDNFKYRRLSDRQLRRLLLNDSCGLGPRRALAANLNKQALRKLSSRAPSGQPLEAIQNRNFM